MPFKKVPGTKKYKSPGGKVWTEKQVKAYHATNGFTKKTDARPRKRR